MAQYEHLPIYKKMFDLAVYTENIVRNFSRYHKYTIGTDMRNIVRSVMVLITRANSVRDKKEILLEIRDKLEELKILARLAREVKAFGSFKSFEYFVKELVEVSRQNEGWLRSQNPVQPK